MKYATWKLNFDDPNYGTGPEAKIVELGASAAGAWVAGKIEDGGIILGYLSSAVDESELTAWQVKNMTQTKALEFCTALNPQRFGIWGATSPSER